MKCNSLVVWKFILRHFSCLSNEVADLSLLSFKKFRGNKQSMFNIRICNDGFGEKTVMHYRPIPIIL